MKFSLFYFSSEHDGRRSGNRYKLLIEGARFADRNGFSAVWTPERHFHPFGGLFPNPSVTGSAIAAVTERVGIRAGSVVLPLHHPVRIVEEWAMVDQLSGGRVGLSFASGWQRSDFVLAPDRYEERKSTLGDAINQLRRLWSGATETFRDVAGAEHRIETWPKLVQSELPVWVTAASDPRTFELAGSLGANVLTHLLGQSISELAEKIQRYRRARAASSSAGSGQVSLMLHTFLDPDRRRVERLIREPFRRYLKSSVDLVRRSGAEFGGGSLTSEEEAALVDHAFDRYTRENALFGTVESSLGMIERLRDAGVDEIACLVDFGIDDAVVLESLACIRELMSSTAAASRRHRATPASAPRRVALVDRLAAHQTTHFQCTPSLARAASDESEEPLTSVPSLELLLIGGEALPRALATELRASFRGPIRNVYGPTEATIWCTSRALDEMKQSEGIVPIGTPLPGYRAHILDDDGRPVPPGAVGELHVGGVGLARGYQGDPALTAERFVPDPFHGVGARLYRTGDRVVEDNDGQIVFLSRKDDQIKMNGYRIEVREIESRLESHPGVASAVVVRHVAESGDERLVAYWTPASSGVAASTSDSDHSDDLLRLPNGLRVSHLGHRDVMASYDEVFIEEHYGRHGIRFPDGGIVFDVGANIGLFALYALQECPSTRVFAFEPIAPTYAVLQANLDRHAPSARHFNFGLSNRSETARFVLFPEAPGLSGRFASADREKRIARALLEEQGSSRRSDWVLSEEDIEELLDDRYEHQDFECELVSLSRMIDVTEVPRIDVLKIDTEGSEALVLGGIREEHWEKIKQVVIEVHSDELLEKCSNLLARHDFDVHVDELIAVSTPDGGEVRTYILYALRPWEVDRVDSSRDADRVMSANETPTVSEIRRYLSDYIPSYMIPSEFVQLDSMPLSASGKLVRSALPNPSRTRPMLETEFVPPQTALESELSAIWKDVLGRDRIGVEDNFFDLGGTSIMLMTVLGRLRGKHSSLSIVDLFRHPTVRGVASHLSGNQRAGEDVERARRRAKTRREARRGRLMGEDRTRG